MKRIVICGSMSFIGKMKECAEKLKAQGYEAILPREEDWGSIPPEEINAYKKKVSMKHFTEIANEKTYAVLVVNAPKKGKANYIGANTFAEIAIAFFFKKRICILNDIYTPYSDELLAWGAETLLGNVSAL